MSNAHWLALVSVSGIGGVTIRKLLDRFGNVESVFHASVEELIEIPRVTEAIVEQLYASPVAQLEEEVFALAEEGIDLLTWDDEQFPPNLRSVPDAPIVLFMRGRLKREDENAVAIVGTRTPSQDGLDHATRLANELGARGLPVVSGLALGIDTAAHRGALDGEGRTLAVLGSGIRVIHPSENIELAEQITRHGAILSELLPNAPPRGPQLMARDRIISGLGRAVIVVEASTQSGSLDTAQRARRQGRLVYALPGSAGTDGLIRGGARQLDMDALNFDALAQEIEQHQFANDNSDAQQTRLF